MGFFKKEVTWEDVIEFLKNNALKIDNTKAEEILSIIVKSNSNKILHYRVSEWQHMMLILVTAQVGLQ